MLTNGIAAAERKDDRLDGEGGGEEPSRPRVCLFEVDHLGAGTVGEVRRVLEVHRQ